MYVIIVYDVEQDRVSKVCNFLRQYLHWVQNSVFEGELTEGKFKEVQLGLKKRINAEKDSILFYKLRSVREVEKEVLGIEKAMTDAFL